MITRRQLLILAAVGCTGYAPHQPQQTWRGRAFGSDVRITVAGPVAAGRLALDAARDTLRRLERFFSLYDGGSHLSRLNDRGRLDMPPEFARLMAACGQAHAATAGLFDPTVQPLFALHAKSDQRPSRGDVERARRLVGWRKVEINGRSITLSTAGMALTLNGIAQGFATDRVCEVLRAHGFDRHLVNVGEYRAGHDVAHVSVADIDGTRLETVELENAAVATSSSHGYTFADGTGHILRPRPDARDRLPWQTVSVVAPSATVADACSTALVLADDDGLARELKRTGVLTNALLRAADGRIVRV